MFQNQFYEALIEGRWRPTINVDTLDDGRYRAHYSSNEKTIECVDASQSYATGEVARLLREGVKNGEFNPR